jgi:ABC-type protease/lipase transport system fused ATPase/permease subunit
MPVYLIVLYLLHPALGLLATGGACIIIVITVLTEVRTRGPARTAMEAASARNALVDATLRNAEIVRAMGLMPALGARWSTINVVANAAYRRATFIAGGLSAAAKSLRFIQQSALLGLGAYLAIRGDLSSGSIIAASILAGRAIAPVDQAISVWKTFIAARQAHTRLASLLARVPKGHDTFDLPAPRATLDVENLTVAAPGKEEAIVKSLTFKLVAGQGLGIIGASGAGKSTLGRALVGVVHIERRHSPGWCKPLAMVARLAGPIRGLPSTGCAAVRRYTCGKHRAYGYGARCRSRHRGRPRSRHSRHDRAIA